MDRVFIEGLVVFAQIGIYDWEQNIQQKIIFDLDMAWDSRKAAETDDVSFCLNYADVSQAIIKYTESKSFFLIERLANEVANMLQKEFGIKWLKLTLHKPDAIAQAKSVGIVIERSM